MQMYRRGLLVGAVVLATVVVGFFGAQRAQAQTGAGSDFAVQVSPSPLVATLKPGQATTLEVHIRNFGAHTETLKIAPRTFKFNSDSQQVEISDSEAPDMASWLSFSAATFTVPSNQTYVERVTVKVPKDAGFSYSFALSISRTTTAQNPDGSTLKGSLALFTLLNIDRPGATRSLELAKFKTTQDIYEYLPATFEVQLKNTGNTIVQPGGNIYVQRDAKDKKPIDALALNDTHGYILPGTTRTVQAEWDNGFGVIRDVEQADGSTKKQTVWDWANFGNIRFGKYTAKLVAIYNDGQRDIPIEGEVSFWVIPWKILLGVLVVVALIGVGVWSIVRKTLRLGKKLKRR